MENVRYVLMLNTDPDDRDLTESTLIEIGNKIPVRFANSLVQLDEIAAECGLPSIILVNDHGVAHTGSASLRALKQQDKFAGIPVIILGEVSSPSYIRECYLAGANSFIIKPSTIAATTEKIQSFFQYWFYTAAI